jgi:hypothetical protein
MHDLWIHGLELTIFGLTVFELIIFELTVFEITVFEDNDLGATELAYNTESIVQLPYTA